MATKSAAATGGDVRTPAPAPLQPSAATLDSAGSSSSLDLDPPPAYTPGRAPAFPESFGLYSGGFSTRTMYLGPSRAQRLFAVSFPSGFDGALPVVLHAGTSDDADAGQGVEGGAQAEIHLTPGQRLISMRLPGGGPPGSAARTVKVNTTQYRADGWHDRHAFRVSVPAPGGGQEVGDFQWRHTGGPEVRALGQRAEGWKLVRLRTTTTAGGQQDGEGDPLMVWAEPRMSLSKAVEFRFLGAAAAGELGERWEVLAVASAIGVWEKKRQQSQNTRMMANGAVVGN